MTVINDSNSDRPSDRKRPRNQDPVLEHFIIKSDESTSGRDLECRFCHVMFPKCKTKRARHHLAGVDGYGIKPCLQVSAEVRRQFRECLVEAESSSKPAHFNTLQSCWNPADAGSADQAIADFFYQNCIGFSVANTESFIAMISAVAKQKSSYMPPSPWRLAHTLLDQTYKQTEIQVQYQFSSGLMNTLVSAAWVTCSPVQRMNEIEKDKKFGLTLCSDGWTDPSGRVLYNFMINSPRASWFVGTKEMEAEEKNAEYIAACFEPYFDKYGDSIVAVCTDSAAVMKAAGRILMQKHPRVTWMPCVPHQAELIQKKIAMLPVFKPAVASIRGLVVWVKRHQIPAALIKQLSTKALYIPGETRFGATLTCLERYLEIQPALKQMIAHKSFQEWVKRLDKKGRVKAAYAGFIINSRPMAVTVKTLVHLLGPVMQLLRLFDGGIPVTGFVYFAMAEMRNRCAQLVEQHKLPVNVQKEVLSIIDVQWETLHVDMHGATYLLNPRYHHLVGQLMTEVELKAGLKAVIKRLTPDTACATKAWDQFHTVYVPGARGFADDMFKNAAADVTFPPHQVWEQYGDDTPELQQVAKMALATYCQASMCERNWKDHSLTHTKKRNRLSKTRAEMLVSVMSNRRALQRAKLLPVEQYNWVGADGEDDSDGEDVDMTLVESSTLFDGEDESMNWDLEDLNASVLDTNAATCFDE